MSSSFNEKDLSNVHISSVARSRTPSGSSVSTAPSLRTPRVTRFAEATSIISPIDNTRSPFADPPSMENLKQSDPAPSDVGFGYISENDATKHSTYPGMDEEAGSSQYIPQTPGSPLKSALKTPGTPGRLLNPLSPTFKEEEELEKQEEVTEKEQKRDLKSKMRVRMAKLVLRGVNFSCSLIVLSMLSTTFMIFNSTKSLPARNDLPAWAEGTNPWPQIVLLVIACISLLFSIVILASFCNLRMKGSKRAQKLQAYYTVFAVAFFVFSIVMWAIGAGILNETKNHSGGTDIWGWSCKENKRKELFQDDVHYALICRMQDWSLVCAIIEIVIELATITIYAIVFYRFYTKHKLHKTMDQRDKARSDLYLAQLRSQSAPNTPGYGLTTPGTAYTGYGGHADPYSHPDDDDMNKSGGEYPTQFAQTPVIGGTSSPERPFQLQPPPARVQNAAPQSQSTFSTPSSTPSPPPQEYEHDREDQITHIPAAPGEQQYAAVPIPGSYGAPLTSPSYMPQSQSQPGQAVSTEGQQRIVSPTPQSPGFRR
ncbi:MAG: hypothetical protein M1834_005520 [Cirrosporium novae-zelandiae]|nr:MAG: hypothetical protein M1834_005520 [Cirrosporium novae-zelandiae]